jgi:hypothetical protein
MPRTRLQFVGNSSWATHAGRYAGLGYRVSMRVTRRMFLGALGAVPALAKDAPPIRTVEVFPVNYPVTAYFKFLPKPERPSVFVKVTCEDGTFGWGQSVPLPTWSYETLESATSALRGYLGPALVGQSPADIEGAHRIMNKTIAASFSTGMPIAKAGLDLALHDLAGKFAGKSVAALWGRKPLERIPLSWTVNVKAIEETEPLMAEGPQARLSQFQYQGGARPEVRPRARQRSTATGAGVLPVGRWQRRL